MCTCTTDVDAYSTNNKYSCYCKLFSFKLLNIISFFYTYVHIVACMHSTGSKRVQPT